MSSKKKTTQTGTTSSTSTTNPWGPAQGGLTDILGAGADAFRKAQGQAGPNWQQVTGVGTGTQTALDNLGWLGGATKGAMAQTQDIAGGDFYGRAGFDTKSLGDLYSFGDLNIKDPSQVGQVISAVAGDRPTYEGINAKGTIQDLTSLIPNYDQLFKSSVAGAAAPIMTDFTNKVIPAMLSQQAQTGGTSSRHAIQANDLVDQFSRTMGDVVASKGLDLAGLQSGDFRTLAGIGGGEASDLRGTLSADWGRLADIGASAFGQDQSLRAAYQTAGSQAQAAQAAARDQIMANAFENQQRRLLEGTGMQLTAAGMVPGMEKAAYDLSLDPSRTLTGIGDQQAGYTDKEIWGPVSAYSSIVNPIAALGGTTNSTGTQTQTQETSGGGLASVIKGLAGLAGVAAPFLGGPAGASGLSSILGKTASAMPQLQMNPLTSYVNYRPW